MIDLCGGGNAARLISDAELIYGECTVLIARRRVLVIAGAGLQASAALHFGAAVRYFIQPSTHLVVQF